MFVFIIFIVIYFIVVCLKEILMSTPRRWRDSSAEECWKYVKDFTHKFRIFYTSDLHDV